MSARKRKIGGPCSLKSVVDASEQVEFVRHKSGDTADIIRTIMYADAKSGVFVSPESTRCLYGPNQYETLRNVWTAVRQQIRYRADRPGHERVKSPGALVASGVGDCKSFSLLIGSILRAMQIPFVYRFTSYAPGDYTHVYVVAHTGMGDVIMDAVHTRFDDEVQYKRKKDLQPDDYNPEQVRAQRATINGLGGTGVKVSQPIFIALLLAGLYSLLK